ncbi:hypothetical protein [Paramagnetospirillum marisnigri]|uniref:hypothetical protein n=1 Tax=Paramagnetospirillum marisnigri TaxID=1285242 RepID=UPI000AEB3AE3|nr:hypothetical protein [Paramagnetospirillum marisnigri]
MLIDTADPATRAECLEVELLVIDTLSERLRTLARIKAEREPAPLQEDGKP